MEKSKEIFGNIISSKDYNKACRTQAKFIKKFGDDREKVYPLKLVDNEVLTPGMKVKQLVMCEPGEKYSKLVLPKNAVIIGNIRMGFGHYRISMAMASTASSMGFTPVWMDLNSFPQTTTTKIIASQNDLYSLGSRLSQKFKLFNKLVWEPMNYEGFKKLSYNAGDQKTSELMTALFHDIPKETPFIATHVWPAQAAIHAGMKHVVNAIPDNWPMGLHLSEGALHTVQTQKTYWGYRYLTGFDGKKILNPMKASDILYTGHYIDDELVQNITNDCKKRIARAKKGEPVRFLLTVGGAGAQGEFFASIIRTLLPYVMENKACLYINCGDYMNVWEQIQKKVPELSYGTHKSITTTHFNDWQEAKKFADNAIASKNNAGNGIHIFCNKDIFAAVYITNLLMRACDILVTKPSELAFYPVPKLFIRRIGGHEKWGAIHSNEIGDGTPECSTPQEASNLVKALLTDSSLIENLCSCIQKEFEDDTYNGAYKVVTAATGKKPAVKKAKK
ncbi:MAG: hypothetical protein MJ169_04730 [Treponema sp.]|nr:hypothetical protein [Treponema sp.]